MKKISFILCFILIIQTVSFSQEKKYDVNFKNISMKEFITFVSSFTGINIVYNESDLKGSVSIASQYPMNTAALMEIFNATLSSNGLNAVRENNYIRVVPDKDFIFYDDKFTEADKIDFESFVTTIIILENYNAVALSNSLSRVKSKYGNIEPLRGVNGLVVRDFGSRIEKMREICLFMDRSALEFQLYSITLENISASKMEQHILKLFSELMKNSLAGHVPMLISDDTSNVLVFITDEHGYRKIEYLISQIDIKNTASNNLPKIYYLKHAKAEDVEIVLNKLFISNQAQTSQSVKTQVKSSVSFDKSTNSIIAMGDQELYNNLEVMIGKLDIPRKQVYVEALILETSLDNDDIFGVEWFGGVKEGSNLGFGNLSGTGILGKLSSPDSSGNNPISSLPSGFTAGIIGNVISFNGIKFPTLGAFFRAVRKDTGINIVSNPQILTLDNEEAEVFVGENRPYLTSERTDSNNNVIQTFEYRNVGVRLKVTPHIAGEDVVQLDIDQEVNKVTSSSLSSVAPITLKRTTKTKVQLLDGSIVLISGLMKDDSFTQETGVPVLSSFPFIGWLFRSSETTQEKTNLMIFITATIIHEQEVMESIIDKRLSGGSLFDGKIDIPKDSLDEDSKSANDALDKE